MTFAFIGGIIFTLGALAVGIVVGLGKITSKFEKTAMENKYPDVGNKQYEPSAKKSTTPLPPPLAYPGLSGTGCASGVTATSSAHVLSTSAPALPKVPKKDPLALALPLPLPPFLLSSSSLSSSSFFSRRTLVPKGNSKQCINIKGVIL